MNRKVVITMLYLVIGFLVAWYILKFFIPQAFILTVNNERLIAIGEFIDNHYWLDKLLGIIPAFITYYLYLCAVCELKKLNYVQCLIILGVVVFSILVERLDVNLAVYYGFIAMVVLPTVFHGKLFNVAIVFSAHIVFQWLSLQIRGLSTMILSFNFLSAIIMTLECYFWLLLFYILFNYYPLKKEIQNNGN